MKNKLLTSLLTLALAFTVSAADKDKHDHEHEAKAGPTGGKLITEVEPHVEFFVNKDKKVKIRFVDDDNKVVAPGEQVISVTLGDRSAPTKLSFTKDGNMLINEDCISPPAAAAGAVWAKAEEINTGKLHKTRDKVPKPRL